MSPTERFDGLIVCYAKCDGCAWGQGQGCFDPPQWHTWAGPEDIEHAEATGQGDITDQKCGCRCADAPKEKTHE